ncbi:MAG TPA: hypothetical protein VJT82_08120, partial [Pyrinomonadaceae bacterium]|nr:hypothetical protein [Pyrinomonadaceae bacterium]
MKKLTPRLAALNAPLALALLVTTLLPSPLAAQNRKREFLTPQEVEMVADTQELDKRSALFVKIAERRLLAITDPQAAATQQAKDAAAWGELPKGTRADLLSDLARIFDEAIDNIDDVATRAPSSPTLHKSVKKLAEASSRFLSQLTPLRDKTDDDEREALEQAIDNLQQILEANK